MSKEFTLKDLLQELAERRGFDFRGYKSTTLERRFRKRMFQLNIGSYEEYAEYIRDHPDEVSALLNTILINVTEFFRDPPAWEILRNEVLPPLISKLQPGATFRVWSAGCASGEEPYSLAIVLAELLGPRFSDYDVKIYATDIDEEELTIARRGEYSPDAVRRVRPEWREKYFRGTGPFRVVREIRRSVIFGRSNLMQDAPISHVNLLVCRNLLIYFDSELQRQILRRVHYALEPGGILFLGKSESQLTDSQHFQRLNARWRIFQRLPGASPAESVSESAADGSAASGSDSRAREELENARSQQRYLLETMRFGVLVLGPAEVVTSSNVAIFSLFGLVPLNITGKRIHDTDLYMRMPELGAHLQACQLNRETTRFPVRVSLASGERLLEVTLRPVLDDRGERTATLVYVDDVSLQEKLQTTVEELESTGEELQSANEELEATNEELQSTNEELETTNEELQSTNEELETTNEELQSLNEELETTNQELEERSKQLDQLNILYSETLERIPIPVILVDEKGRIEYWNSRALKLLGFKSKPPVELRLEQLPLTRPTRSILLRRYRAVLLKGQPLKSRNLLVGGGAKSPVDVHFSLVQDGVRKGCVLITFETGEIDKES